MSVKNYIHHIHGNPVDNTVLDCPDVSYQYNADTYDITKLIIMVLTIVAFVVSIVLIIISNNSVVQIIASAFLGGVFSTIVWFISVWHNDKTNAEISRIEHCINVVEQLLDSVNNPTYIVNAETLEITLSDDEDISKRFLVFVQKISNIKSSEEIDSSKFVIKWLDGNDCTVDEFMDKFYKFMEEQKVIESKYAFEVLLNYNEYIVKTELSRLKEKLLRQRLYVICGDAPVSTKSNIDKRIKLKRTFELLHRKEKND